MEVLIVGAGAMGRWVASALEASVTFVDVDAEAAADAADAVDGTVGSLEDDDRYDVVCLAVPMTRVGDAIDAHASRAEHALVDVSGVMGPPLEAMAARAPERERVSLHPLFAPERAPGSIAVVRDRPGPVSEELLAGLESRGNRLVETTAAEHDEAMESVQAAAHAAVLSFALAAKRVPDGFETPIYADLADLVELVTAGTPRVYADIQRTFEGADAVADAAATIADADEAEFEALYREAAADWLEPADAENGGGAESKDGVDTGETR